MNEIQKANKSSDISNPNSLAPQVGDNKRFYRKKYRLALQMYAIVDIHEYAQTQPTWTAKDVLSTIIKDYDPQLPSEILLEMSQFIVHEWDKVQLAKKQHIAAAGMCYPFSILKDGKDSGQKNR